MSSPPVSKQLLGELQLYLGLSERIPGWTRGSEAEALGQAALELPPDAEIVEIGSFLGCASVILAGASRIRGSGRLHCVDPFDASGDDFSVPHYAAILLALAGRTQKEHFEENVSSAGLSDWIVIHQGRAAEVATAWRTPIDMLFLDGDQSPAGARLAYEGWAPWLKPGGIIALHNSANREYQAGHEGHRRLVVRELLTPRYRDVRSVGSTTFALKC